MPVDFEQQLRQALHARARQVTPDPRMWERVQARIHRQQTFRWVLAGAVTAAVAAVVALVVAPALLNPSRNVDLAPAEQPGDVPPSPAEQDGGPAATGCAGAVERIAAVYVRRGAGLRGLCLDGSMISLTESAGDERSPVVAPDGRSVLFERLPKDGSGPQIVHLDLESGNEQVITGGRSPALAPDGRLAWVQDEPGDGVQPRVLVGELFSEPQHEIAVAEDGTEELRVGSLSWTGDSDTLLYTAGYEGMALWQVHLDDGNPRRIEPDADGVVYAAPALSGKRAFAAVLRGCCTRTEGDPLEEVAFGLLPLGPDAPTRFRKVTDPAAWPGPGLDPNAEGTTVSYIGMLDARRDLDRVLWTRGDQDAWLVSSGETVFLARADGSVELLGTDLGTMAGNPAAAPGPAPDTVEETPVPPPATPEPESAQEGLPAVVAEIRAEILAAARAGDLERLRPRVEHDAFTYSFGGDGDPIGYWQRQAEAGDDPLAMMAALLRLPYTIEQPGDTSQPIYVWPSAFNTPYEELSPRERAQLEEVLTPRDLAYYRETGQYLAHRLGIRADGVWLYFVAGD